MARRTGSAYGTSPPALAAADGLAIGTGTGVVMEAADILLISGTYLACVYHRLASNIGGQHVEHERMVNAPNWLPLSFSAAGGPWLGEPGAVVRARNWGWTCAPECCCPGSG